MLAKCKINCQGGKSLPNQLYILEELSGSGLYVEEQILYKRIFAGINLGKAKMTTCKIIVVIVFGAMMFPFMLAANAGTSDPNAAQANDKSAETVGAERSVAAHGIRRSTIPPAPPIPTPPGEKMVVEYDGVQSHLDEPVPLAVQTLVAQVEPLPTETRLLDNIPPMQMSLSSMAIHDVGIRSCKTFGTPLRPGTMVTLQIEVVNFGNQREENVPVRFLFQKKQVAPTCLITLPAGKSATLSYNWEIPSYIPGPNDLVPLYFVSFILGEDEREENIENNRLDLRFGFNRKDGTIVPLNNNIIPLHKVETPVHQWIAKEAYDYFVSQIEGADISSYLGTISGSHGNNQNTLLEGTAAEDKSCRPPLYQCWPDMPYFRHFCEGADGSEIDNGYLWYDSAPTQAENIWQYAIDTYTSNKALAFYYLGHVAHLVGDMTVPAHTHNDPHVQILGDGDAYEETIAYSDNFKLWYYGGGRSGDWDYHLPLRGCHPSRGCSYWVFYRTANFTEDYDSDDYDGDGPPYYNPDDYPETWHRPGEVDRSDGIDIGEITIIGDDLMPYAIRRIAELYRRFYREVDTSAPSCTMTYPTSEDVSNPDYRTSTSAFNLTAGGSDSQSGIINWSYHFRYSYWTGSSWTDWADVLPSPTDSSVSFDPPYNNKKYAFYVYVWNGAGLAGASNVKYLFVDATDPTSPTITGYSDSSHSSTLVSGNEYPYPNPHFHYSASDSGSGIKGYYYYWGTNPNADPFIWTTSVEYTASGLTSGNDYYFRVKAKDKAGNIGSISTFTYKYRVCTPPSITSHPSPPSLTICSGQSHQYCVSASGTPPLSYQWRKNGTDIPGATSSCYPATQSGSYSCRVTNSCGSVYSNSATLTVNTPPSLPSNFSNTSVTTDSITWTWQDNSNNEDGFRGHDPSHNIKWTAPANTTSKTESDLSVNTQYTRHVHAYNTCGESSPSNGHSVYTLANAPGPAPFSNITRTSIQANWTANGNPPGTQYFCENVTRETNLGWTSNTYWNETGLDCGTQYCYQVKAKNGDGVPTATTNLGCQSTLPCPVPDIRVSESFYDYNSVVVGSYEDWILTIYNDGGANLSITDFNGLEASDFNLVGPPSLPFTIEPNESNDLTVRFTPSSGDTKNATLSIANDDPDENPIDVSLVGIGVPSVLYVDVNSLNDPGSGTPEDPYRRIQDGIDAAIGGAEVHVAEGEYNESITMKDGVNLYGGYDSNDWFAPRDPNANETIIDANGLNDSVVHIIDADVTIDGFTITKGYAEDGGGVYCNGSSPTIANCTIVNNRTFDGQDGGDGGSGAGVYCSASSSPVMLNCSIIGNITGNGGDGFWDGFQDICPGRGGDGAGIYCSSITLIDCTIMDNFAGEGGIPAAGACDNGVGGGRGGGVYCSSAATIIGCTINGNGSGNGSNGCYGAGDGGEGGGIYAMGTSMTITNCMINNNTTGYGGSGCYGMGDGGAGAGIYSSSSTLILSNSILSGNATGDGGYAYEWTGGNGGNGAGIFCYSATITNCTIANNNTGVGGTGFYGASDGAIGQGGGVYADNNTAITNTVIWYNTPDQLLGHDCNNVAYCDIGEDICLGGTGNISVDPCFADPNNNDYHLLPQSLCIDSGDPNYVADANEVDIDGDARVIGGRIDMGADEYSYGELSDFNGDGIVNFKDFSILAYYWMDYLCSEPDWCEGSDFDESRYVDFGDLKTFAENWLWQAIWYSQ